MLDAELLKTKKVPGTFGPGCKRRPEFLIPLRSALFNQVHSN